MSIDSNDLLVKLLQHYSLSEFILIHIDNASFPAY
jgi:hypothetical protein